jgi:acetylglutamate kinase
MRSILLKFMEKTGMDAEFKLFFEKYHKLPKMKFAVIKVSGETIDKHLNMIAEDIAYLNKMDMYPIIVHGAGTMLNEKLPESKKVDGIRVTSKEDMHVIKEVFNKINYSMQKKIAEHGGEAEEVDNLFECEKMEEYGYVGKIKKINLDKIKAVLDKNVTPIISPIGICSNGEYVNINADTAAKELVMKIGPVKMIMMTETGGVLDENGQVMPFLNLFNEEDFDHVTGGMLLKVKEIAEFVKKVPDSAVVITSAENLLKEIFTIKGSGTYMKYHMIKDTTNVKDLDLVKAKELLEDAFDKKLVEGYFDDPSIKEIIYEKDYDGIALIKDLDGMAYLDKLAVSKFNQGTGLGKSLWNEMMSKYKTLLWRATPKNPFNSFYMKKCDGMIKYENWYFYWINLPESKIIPYAKKVIALPKTMIAESDAAKKSEA